VSSIDRVVICCLSGLGVQCSSMAHLNSMSMVLWLAVRQACSWRYVCWMSVCVITNDLSLQVMQINRWLYVCHC